MHLVSGGFSEDPGYQWKDPMSRKDPKSHLAIKSFVITAHSTASYNFICPSVLEMNWERIFQMSNIRLEISSGGQLLLYVLPGTLILAKHPPVFGVTCSSQHRGCFD